MSLMARNDSDGTFTKLLVINVNQVGTIANLRIDINAGLLGTAWKDKYILLKETLKDIPEADEEKLTVSEIYSSDCVLIRWDIPQGTYKYLLFNSKKAFSAEIYTKSTGFNNKTIGYTCRCLWLAR